MPWKHKGSRFPDFVIQNNLYIYTCIFCKDAFFPCNGQRCEGGESNVYFRCVSSFLHLYFLHLYFFTPVFFTLVIFYTCIFYTPYFFTCIFCKWRREQCLPSLCVYPDAHTLPSIGTLSMLGIVITVSQHNIVITSLRP